MSWARCRQCKDLDVVDFDRANIRDDNLGGPVFLRLREACHGMPREVAIVPPTWNKSQHYAEISNVWRVAAQKLSQAENIVIMGYSLPPTDEFFRYLFALGTVGTARLQRLIVFDPDPEVDKRYRGLWGPMALQRYQLRTNGDGLFENAIHGAIQLIAN